MFRGKDKGFLFRRQWPTGRLGIRRWNGVFQSVGQARSEGQGTGKGAEGEEWLVAHRVSDDGLRGELGH